MYKPMCEKIKIKREKIGLSRQALSYKAGLPNNAVLRMERGNSSVHPLRARAIASALDCKVEDIFTPINKGA